MKLEVIERGGKYATREKHLGLWFYSELKGCERGVLHLWPNRYCWGVREDAQAIYRERIKHQCFAISKVTVLHKIDI